MNYEQQLSMYDNLFRAIGVGVTCMLIVLFTFFVVLQRRIELLFSHLNFIKHQIIKIMSLQDQINAALGNIAADISAGAADAATISNGMTTLSAGLAKLLANAGIDGTAILGQLQTLQTAADGLKSNLDSAATAVTNAAASIAPAPAPAPTNGTAPAASQS